jgi:hypothetical protein
MFQWGSGRGFCSKFVWISSFEFVHSRIWDHRNFKIYRLEFITFWPHQQANQVLLAWMTSCF